MKVLNLGLLHEARMGKSDVGIKVNARDNKIPCLLFADDCLHFYKANSNSCHKIKSLLDPSAISLANSSTYTNRY